MDNKYDAVMARIGFEYLPEHVPVSEQAIREFEKAIGYQLSGDYRHFLSKYGFSHGKPYTRFSNLDDPAIVESAVGRFYGLNSSTSGDLLTVREAYRGRLPDHLQPIAQCAGGEICISLAGDDVGRLYWWVANVRDPSDDPGDPYPGCELIAYDFDSFMNSLKVHPS